MEFLRKIWAFVQRWRSEVVFIFLAAAVLASAFIPFVREIWLYGDEWTGEATRSIVLTLGGLGALYGLILAARRVQVNEKQAATAAQNATTAEKNLFNDRLGRAASLLAEEKLVMRVMGVDILEATAKDSTPESDAHNFVLRNLLSFVQSQELPEIEEGKDPREVRRQKFTDVERAIKVLGEITPPDARNKIDLSSLDLRYLHLQQANLNGAFLWDAKLQGADLQKANLQRSYLQRVNLQRADLQEVKLQRAHLPESKLKSANLIHAKLQGADLQKANLQRAELRFANLQGAYLSYVNLQGADLSATDLQDVKGLTQEKLDSIIYQHPLKNLPAGLQVPPDRAYEWLDKDGSGSKRRYFVPSDKPWSEKNVEEWAAEELREEVAKELEEEKEQAEERKLVKGGISGLLLDVVRQKEPDRFGEERDVITITIKTDDGTKKLRNNWDGSKREHDERGWERWEKAARLKGKRVRTIVWGGYDKNKWWSDLEEIKD